MRWGISIPQLDTGRFDADGVRAFLTRAEQLGIGSGWTIEQVIGPTPVIAPLELLAWAAGCTTTLRLGVAVLVTTQHDPLQLAAAITAVDRLSHGRIEVGVAPGGGFRDFAAFGVERASFVAWFTEGLALMKAAWSDAERVGFHGRFRDVDGLAIMPKPVQRPHPPIWFGANAPAALARAVRLGDGFLGAGSTPTDRFAPQVDTVRAELDRQGRDPSTFGIAKRVYLAVDDDAARARAHVVAGLHRIYGTGLPGIEDCAVAGTPDAVASALREVAAAGAELIVLNPLGASVAEDRDQLERLAVDVLPHVD